MFNKMGYPQKYQTLFISGKKLLALKEISYDNLTLSSNDIPSNTNYIIVDLNK